MYNNAVIARDSPTPGIYTVLLKDH